MSNTHDDVLLAVELERVASRKLPPVDLEEPVVRSRHEGKLDRPRQDRWLRAPHDVRVLHLRLELGDAFLPRSHVALASFDRGAHELHGAQLAASSCQVGFGFCEARFTIREVAQEVGELGLARLEIGVTEPEHALDRGT